MIVLHVLSSGGLRVASGWKKGSKTVHVSTSCDLYRFVHFDPTSPSEKVAKPLQWAARVKDKA
eukprot:6491452-Amphidinium_carterae.2